MGVIQPEVWLGIFFTGGLVIGLGLGFGLGLAWRAHQDLKALWAKGYGLKED